MVTVMMVVMPAVSEHVSTMMMVVMPAAVAAAAMATP